MSIRNRKRSKAPTPLGVLEFSSALNGDDPLLILQKLRQFVNVVGYERRLALSPSTDADANNPVDESGENASNGDTSGDEESILSFDDGDAEASPKRQKLNAGTSAKIPAWKLDQNNYQVPFVGTSVSKGATGTINRNVWPTGFMEVYRKHSPSGVELINNDFISAVPPGGIHRSLHKESIFCLNNDDDNAGKRRGKGGGGSSHSGGQTRGKIMSISLQSNYWMALSEWILGFVSMNRLKKQLIWEEGHVDAVASDCEINGDKSEKCAVPPAIMAILMKQRLPEWIDAIHNYTRQQYHYAQQRQKERNQQKKQNQKKQQQRQKETKGDHQVQRESQRQHDNNDKKKQLQLQKRQQREEALLLSAVYNLNALCHLSNGTAQEVLRKLTAVTSISVKVKSGADNSHRGGKFGSFSKAVGGGAVDGTSWMIQLFQQSTATSSLEPQVECLRLVCILLEINDYNVLSRLTEVPAWLLKQSSKQRGSSVGEKKFGMAYIALRYGIQQLLELEKRDDNDGGDAQEKIDSYAQCITRLVRDVREIILPPPSMGEDADEIDGASGSKNEFTLGVSATAELLSGEVLNNLTKLSQLAPPFDSSTESIQSILDGDDAYERLSQIEVASVESRRLLLLLLADKRRSPFLYDIHHKARGAWTTQAQEQSPIFLSQISKALHAILANQGQNPSMKLFLGLCLKTTPELVPHFFRLLQFSDPKPTYRSLAALTLIEGVIREAPPPHSHVQGDLLPTKQILSAIVPACVTKNILGKVVQSQSALLVSSGLKIIITILRRAHGFISSLSSSTNEIGHSLSQAITRHLPEVSLLLSIPSRFDPFEQHLGNSTSHSNALVVHCMCDAVECYAGLDSSLMANIKFDWTKLVPNESQDQMKGRRFSNAEPLLQHRILKTLLAGSHLRQSSVSSKMLPSVLTILVTTTITEVYTVARTLALSLMERENVSRINNSESSFLPDESDETLQCQKYESSLWIDGISADVIQELVTMIEESNQLRVQQKIMISQAWSNASMECVMPSIGTSSLLLSSICKFLGGGASFSNKMSLLLIQIATKMLLFMEDPKPFAAIIVYCSQENTLRTHMAGLYRIAKSLQNDSNRTWTGIESLVSDVFLPESSLSCIVRTAKADVNNESTQLGVSQCTDATDLRQCLSIMKYSGGQNEKLKTLARRILINIIEAGETVPGFMSRLVAFFGKHSLQKFAEIEGTNILLLSATRSKEIDIPFGCDSKLQACSVGMSLVSELLRCSTSFASCEDKSFISNVWKLSASALQSKGAHTSGLRDFLLTIMMHTTPTEKDSESTVPLPPGEMFDLWSIIARNLTTKLAVEFCLQLEDCLAVLFGNMCGQGAWVIYQRICTLTPEAFVDLSVKTLLKRVESSDDGESGLLPYVLRYDCSNFSCLSNLFVGSDTERMSKLWDGEQLDLTAATFVLQAYKQKEANEIIASAMFAEAVGVIGRRFLDLLTKETVSMGMSLELLLSVLEVMYSNQIIPHDTQQGILELFRHLENGTTVLAIDHEIRLMNLAFCAESSDKSLGPNTSILLTTVFMRCCKVLSKHVKKMARTKGIAETRWVESLVNSFSSFVGCAHSFDEEIIKLSSDVIDNCIIQCLKYGMMDSNTGKPCSVLGGCLKVIRLLMAKSYSPGSSTQVPLGSVTPSQVHAMALSHSSFQAAISSSNIAFLARTSISDENGSSFCDGLTQQLELIQLLLCTLSLDDENHVKVEKETLMTILSAYNASTNAIDISIRQLLFLYERNSSYKDEIMMNDLRWGSMATRHTVNVGEDGSWEWFVDALELDRIRSTLSQFPVTDTLVADPFRNVEEKTKQSEHNGLLGESDDETNSDESNIDTGLSAKECSHDALNDKHDLWRGAGDDLRYSPGFILPLILGTIEAHTPHEQGVKFEEVHPGGEMLKKDSRENAQYQAFGNICRKMADRGGIALAIASLSSRCPSLRKVAVAICGLFLKSLQMQESHGIKSWHVRPQQEMIMSSIQRGLAVRRSIQIQKHEEQEGIELGSAHKHNVPMLPSVSAVFLAKALLVLSKPGDDMYGQMNRYFLRLADYHGAFQDCFGLPAFLSLYCSASDDLSRCRTERTWALLTLKDSAVDEYCYRIISQHHVPELIMSSFDSLVDNPESKSELYLTIDVLESLIQSGGTRASNDLIKSQGLLSWLHGIISWRTVSSVFPYDALKCRFLKLVTTAVNSYTSTKFAGDGDAAEALVFYEKIPLANAVVRMCLDGGDTVGNGIDSSPEPSMALLETTGNALWAIYLADKESEITITPQGLTTIGDMTSLLGKMVCHKVIFGKALASICDLPLLSGNGNDLTSAKLFCELALGFIIEMNTHFSPDMILLTLNRVHEVIKLHPCLGNEPKLVFQIMQCRHMAVLVGGIQIWGAFLQYLTNSA